MPSNRHLVLSAFFAASAGLAVALPAPAAVNSSDVQASITYTFVEAVFTDTGDPAFSGSDYDFDPFPDHDFGSPFVYSLGDGTGSFSASADFAGEVHDYGGPPPQFGQFFLETDPITIDLSTYGQSSTPGSNGSAEAQSHLYFYVYNYTSDPTTGLEQSLTFLFNYEYTVDMTLIENAPAGGQANGFFDVSTSVDGDETGEVYSEEVIAEWHGGPGLLNGLNDFGTLELILEAGNSYAELRLITKANSTTLVNVPEPGTVALLALGGLAAMLRRRRKL